ncbi:MAG: tRNA preQ1(34) S-adenosylmethionine ribosyltransferase-isomerase QueA [Candidatus Omnitrophota bacterium]
MKLSDFDYDLPKELIAQKPLAQRDASRLLAVDRKSGALRDQAFHDLADHLPAGDVLVLNDTKVFAARLLGKKKETQGKTELLLLEPYERPKAGPEDFTSAAEAEAMGSEAMGSDPVKLGGLTLKRKTPKRKIWRCLVQPALREGQEIVFGAEKASAFFLKRDTDGIPLVEFQGVEDVKTFAARFGTMPLPPYIKREADAGDLNTYQTVYASAEGAVAAPTAGLHFTDALLDKIQKKGVDLCRVTLHVGYGTFKPVDNLEEHKMHSEAFELSPETADRINRAKTAGRGVWAVGTTTLRVLETCVQNKRLIPGKSQTDLFIREPFTFEAVDHLITNFHLPRTTLLLLVSAFMGEDLRKKAYAHAIAERYRFYSYGDAMLIL